jgi:phage baseplate assembly protein W
MRSDAFLGTGWSFPPVFSKADYSAGMVSGPDDIRESLYILFSTLQGERIMLPDYGSSLGSLLYENLNNTIAHLLKEKLGQAILMYEPRVTVDDIDITEGTADEGCVWISIGYTIGGSNERANMVYPFYLTEGTNVRFNV